MEPVVLAASLRHADARPPQVHLEDSDGWYEWEGERYLYRLAVLGGSALLHIDSYPEAWLRDPNMFVRLARDVLDSRVPNIAFIEGVGVRWFLESASLPGVGVVGINVPRSDRADEVASALGRVTSVDSRMRFALRDFNDGMCDTENCYVSWYRAIELAARAVLDLAVDQEVRTGEWDRFHELLGTTRDDLSKLMEFNKPHRHGRRITSTEEDFESVMASTRAILRRAIEHLADR
jgi:hypothetical protein